MSNRRRGPARQDGAGARASAARLLHQVVDQGRTLDQVLAAAAAKTPAAAPEPLVREMLFGSLRHYFSLSAATVPWLRQPFQPKDRDIGQLLIVGAYQLLHMRVPDHAAINETVAACGRLGKPWARGLVNAVLRRCLEQRDAGPAPAAALDHPDWLVQRLREQYGDAADALMAANNQRAPMVLRINRSRLEAPAYHAQLQAAGISGRPLRVEGAGTAPGASAWVLNEACPAEMLPGFADGLVAVQDGGAQFAAALLEAAPGERLLDACAAPGGKLFHLLETRPQVRATVLEQSPERLQHLRAEAERLGHRGFTALTADATGLDWWDGEPFRHILLDAPCSGTGTLRRHPDIKVLRGPADLARHADLQRRLLANLWHVLEPGGSLLYCTCSILAEENDAIIGAFLAEHGDARNRPLRLASGIPREHGWQLLPTNPDTDGFYYALLGKAPDTDD